MLVEGLSFARLIRRPLAQHPRTQLKIGNLGLLHRESRKIISQPLLKLSSGYAAKSSPAFFSHETH
jgi:hypothetical protein